MGESTAIEWTHWPGTKGATWNPVRGCSRISAGCQHCYAERFAARFSGEGGRYQGFAEATINGPRWTGAVELNDEALLVPLRWKAPRTIFCASMTDVFHEDLPDHDIDRIMAVMQLAPQHRFLVLTKRAARMASYFSGNRDDRVTAIILAGDEIPRQRGRARSGSYYLHPPNVWLGVSVENQQMAKKRIPHLRKTGATNLFVSYEPALGPVDFSTSLWAGASDTGAHELFPGEPVRWIIVGGESGPGARPFDIAWARSTIAQCKAVRVACFVKQLGANPFGLQGCGDCDRCAARQRCDQSIEVGWSLKSKKGGDMAEWPEDLRVRQFPVDCTAPVP